MLINSKNYKILYLVILIPYIVGLFLPLMEADSAQHATMAMRMYRENDFLHIIKFHAPYLDKPHMHFWLAAFSFKLFGVSEIAYRLPAFAFLMLGAYSTFRLGKLLYNRAVGHIAALIFLSAQTIILSAHDVRTDAVLTGATIFSLWKITSFIKSQKIVDLVLGAVFLGIAFSTKGLIAVIFVGLCVFCHLLYKRNWFQFFNWKLIIGFLAFFISITPTLYAYYYQFDLHPELVVEGQKNISGVRFILWDQVFNRLQSKGFHEQSPDYFFFFHTLLWAFIPFSLVAYLALFKKVQFLIETRFQKIRSFEFLTTGGFITMLLLISFSKFKLPHYLNILMPVLAIVTASFIYKIHKDHKEKYLKAILIIQYITVGALILGGVYLGYVVFEVSNWLVFTISIIGLILLLILTFSRQKTVWKAIIISIFAIAWTNFNLNTLFYPTLLQYQGGLQLAEIVKEKQIPIRDVFVLGNDYNWSFDFNTQQNTKALLVSELDTSKDIWLVLSEHVYNEYKDQLIIKERYEVPHFRVTRLSLDFLKKHTRKKVLSKQYLIKI